MSVTKDLLVEQGATFTLPFRLKDKLSGEPINLTGYNGVGHIKRRVTDDVPTGTFIVTIVDPIAGTGLIHMPAEATAVLPAGNDYHAPASQYVYDIKLVSATNTIRLLAGKLRVSPEVTVTWT